MLERTNKSVFVLDIDDVVVHHVPGFVKWNNENWAEKITVDDYTEDWGALWGVDPEEVERRKVLFFTPEIIGAFQVIEGAPEGIMALAKEHRLIGVTSRRESLKSISQSVLDQIAPGVVEQVITATYFDANGQKITRSKEEICREINAQFIMDDHLKHCLAGRRAGAKAILFGDYKWNRGLEGEDLSEGIVRAHTWTEVPISLEKLTV